jgi:hypothetical protein
MEQKATVLAFIDDLQQKDREPEHDAKYFWAAHEYLETHDLESVKQKLKAFRIPFQGTVEKGQKVEHYQGKIYAVDPLTLADQKRIIQKRQDDIDKRMAQAAPKYDKFGKIIEDEYSVMRREYFKKKDVRRMKADYEID